MRMVTGQLCARVTLWSLSSLVILGGAVVGVRESVIGRRSAFTKRLELISWLNICMCDA